MKKFVVPLLLSLIVTLSSLSLGCNNNPISNWMNKPKVETISSEQPGDITIINGKEAYIDINYLSYSSVAKKIAVLDRLDIKNLHINVYSMGGKIGDMFAIVDLLKDFKKTGGSITTHSRGGIASAAVPIYLMGDVRYMSKHSIVMLHPHSLHNSDLEKGPYYKTIKDLPTTKTLKLKMSKLWTKWYAEILVERTFLTFEEAMKYLTSGNSSTGQWWFSAEEAYDMGIVHILEE